MKKVIAFLLCAAALLALAACVRETEPNEAVTQQEEMQAEEPVYEITFEEMTVVDNDELTVIIRRNDDYGKFGMAVYIENKLEDVSIAALSENCSVNGVMVPMFLYQELDGGLKSNTQIIVNDYYLGREGIDRHTVIEFDLNVYNYSKYSPEPIFSKSVQIFPYGEEKASYYERKSQQTDIVLEDNDDIAITVIKCGCDEYGARYGAYICIENRTDQVLNIEAYKAEVNGRTTYPRFDCSVAPGKSIFTEIRWMVEDLEQMGVSCPNGIRQIKTEIIVTNEDNEELMALDVDIRP